MAAKCMYLNTITRLFRGGLRPVTFPLPSPVTFRETTGEVRVLEHSLPDTNVLVLPVTYTTPSCEAISLLADRVGGSLNGLSVEIGVRAIRVVGDEVHIPFFVLDGTVLPSILPNVVLTVAII